MQENDVAEGTTDVDPFAGAPLGRLVFERTYSRSKPDGGKEDWYETVQRVVDGNLSLVSPAYIEPTERERLIYLITNRIAIPAGRHLWASGASNNALSNCFRAGFSDNYADHACFHFNQLMLGGGVGANFSSSYYTNMKRFLSRIEVRFTCKPDHPDYEEIVSLGLLDLAKIDDPHAKVERTVADSREGWVEALNTLIWHSINSIPVTIVYDVSEVREKGAPIRGFGGTAAGPMPLMQMLIEVADLIKAQRGKRPDPLFAMEVDHAIANCVVAGNVRRSARMSILHWKDPYIFEFIHCKEDKSKHWSTNISVEVDEEFFEALGHNDSHAVAVLDQTIQGMLRDGEPGFYNSSLAQEGEVGDVRSTNPCGEIPLESWESCILGHVNLAMGTQEERNEAFRLMARFLVRTTEAPMPEPKQREIVQRNRRIGVGFFGLQEYMAKHGMSYEDDDLSALEGALNHWYAIVRRESNRYADEMHIPRPIKCTTVAPTGTIAKLAGTTEGVQPVFATHFIRRIRFAENDSNIPKEYPQEPCLYTKGTTVVSVPCMDPVIERLNGQGHLVVDSYDLHPERLLRLQAIIQEHYSDNAISVTVNVKPDQISKEDLTGLILTYLPRLKGMTLFPEKSRPQSPYEKITEDQYWALASRSALETMQADVDQCVGACPIK